VKESFVGLTLYYFPYDYYVNFSLLYILVNILFRLRIPKDKFKN
jgi:hypothetical protein